MLALRLARGAHPLVLLRRLAVAAASAGTGFLLLCALGYALGHPRAADSSALRLAWSAVPLAATVYLAVAVARTDPATRPRSALSAVGLGPARLMLLSAISTAISCTLGSMVALLFFLHLRGDISGLPLDGAAAELLGAGRPLPLAAVCTLLLVVPVAGTVAGALALRPQVAKSVGRKGSSQAADPKGPRSNADGGGEGAGPADTTPVGAAAGDEPAPPAPQPAGLPWGVALMAVGLAVETYAAREAGASGFPLPGRLATSSAAVLGGWAITALGLAVAGPALTYLCGKLLQAARPGAARLLAGRALQEESRRIGRPLGVVCAVASAGIAALSLYGGPAPRIGPLTVLGGGLVAGCALLTLATAAIEARQSRADTTAALLALGAPASLLRGAAGLRALGLFAVFGPLTWLIGTLAAAPLTG
ncbi:hypothetical protein [Streptomyces cavernicola]|uniref:Integral membrane protein n=1 Tax=Streptomyces cavernicola TaxID=3043613 RepID=A0ABT6SH03_9ACTN|nr:hypothetical protein [Streptomyces sp. B-S-A6]MDI3407250.1 hypothetical protein [Streptomyces sp. B-S-A6]